MKSENKSKSLAQEIAEFIRDDLGYDDHGPNVYLDVKDSFYSDGKEFQTVLLKLDGDLYSVYVDGGEHRAVTITHSYLDKVLNKYTYDSTRFTIPERVHPDNHFNFTQDGVIDFLSLYSLYAGSELD